MILSPLVIFLICIFLFLEGFYSGSELALLSADRLQLKKKAKSGDHGAQLALKLLKNPERILSTTLVMTSTCIMATSVLLTLELKRTFGEHAEWYAVLTGSTLVVIFGELIPKFFYRRFSSVLAPKIALPIFYTQTIMRPFLSLASIYTSQIARIARPIELLWSAKNTGKDELHVLLNPESDDTRVKTSEKHLIKKILKFREKIASNGLLPLVQIDAIEKTATLAEAFDLYEKRRHSRLPVYDERIDNIIGMLELSSIIRIQDTKQSIERFIKAPFYVAENQRLDMILKQMLDDDTQMAIVVDEYGGAIGLLTREDIFEQIVGDLQDEDDLETKSIRMISPRQWIVKATTPIVQLNEETQLELPEGDYDTLSGFLLRQFSCIPDSGDELYFDTPAGQILFTIREASPRKIESVSVERIQQGL